MPKFSTPPVWYERSGDLNETLTGLAGGADNVAVGLNSSAIAGIKNTVVGFGSVAEREYATVIGSEAKVTQPYSTAVGAGAKVCGANGIAIGSSATIGLDDKDVDDSISLGIGASVKGTNAIAIGNSAAVGLDADGSISLGVGAIAAEKLGAIAIGGCTDLDVGGAYANGNGAIAIGGFVNKDVGGAYANGNGAIAIGSSATTGINKDGAIAIGLKAQANGVDGIAIGDKAEASGVDSIAIGYNAKVTDSYTIQLGENTKIYTFKIGKATIDPFATSKVVSALYSFASTSQYTEVTEPIGAGIYFAEIITTDKNNKENKANLVLDTNCKESAVFMAWDKIDLEYVPTVIELTESTDSAGYFTLKLMAYLLKSALNSKREISGTIKVKKLCSYTLG